MEWVSFLSQPITQITALVALISALQKSGVDVIGFIKWLFARAGRTESAERDADVRNALQPLLSQMEELSLHFNHETTSNQEKTISLIEGMHSKQDKAVQILSEIKEYGIKIRKE